MSARADYLDTVMFRETSCFTSEGNVRKCLSCPNHIHCQLVCVQDWHDVEGHKAYKRLTRYAEGEV